MYDIPTYLGVSEIAAYLGVGRNTVLKLCQERPNHFPVVRVGNRYQADAELLAKWRADWFAGKFEITI